MFPALPGASSDHFGSGEYLLVLNKRPTLIGFLSQHLTETSPAAWAAVPTHPNRKLHLVLGNESCDLDSAVSAMTLAFVYAQRYREHDYVPVLNIPRRDYP